MTAIVQAGLAAEVSLKSPNAVVSIETEAAGNVITVTVTVDPGGVYLLRAWLADNADGSTPTLTPPDTSRDVDWWAVTNASGVWTKQITHTGTNTWYMGVVVVGVVTTTGSLEFT